MTQTVNFYQPEFHRKHAYRQWLVFGGIGIALTLLLSINLVQQVNISRLGAELAEKQTLVESRKLLHKTLESQLTPKQQSPMLQAQLESLRQANQSRHSALNFLNTRSSDNMIGFSFILSALGRQRDNIEGIWLKKIILDDGGFNLGLDGYSHSAELLPQLIQTLGQEEIFRGHEFRHIKISRSADHKQIMDFELDTRAREQQGNTETLSTDLALFIARLKQLTTLDKVQN